MFTRICLGILSIGLLVGSAVADTTIEYTLDGDWHYTEGAPGTLSLSANPSGGITVAIDVPSGIEEGGLAASMHNLPGYSLNDNGFIELRYKSLESTITGNKADCSMILELEFYDSDFAKYEMSMVIAKQNETTFFGTWFEKNGVQNNKGAHKPVPNGLSITEGALGLYSYNSYILPYFKDAAGNTFYPFKSYDVSGITGMSNFSVDNDFEAETSRGGTVKASVNLRQVVYGPVSDIIIPPTDVVGTIGSQITMTGPGFGTKKGKILIGGASTKILNWTDAYITYEINKSLPPEVYDLVLILKGADPITYEGAFTMMAPEITSVDPSPGLSGEIVILGNYFGTKKGTVYLEYEQGGKLKKKNCKVKSWGMDGITFIAPKTSKSFLAGDYPLKVMNKVGYDEAPSTFTVN